MGIEGVVALVARARRDDLACGEIVGRFQDMDLGCVYALLGGFDLAQEGGVGRERPPGGGDAQPGLMEDETDGAQFSGKPPGGVLPRLAANANGRGSQIVPAVYSFFDEIADRGLDRFHTLLVLGIVVQDRNN